MEHSDYWRANQIFCNYKTQRKPNNVNDSQNHSSQHKFPILLIVNYDVITSPPSFDDADSSIQLISNLEA